MPKKIDQKAEKRARNEEISKKYEKTGKRSRKEMKKLKTEVKDAAWARQYEELAGYRLPSKQDIIKHDKELRQARKRS